MNFIVGILLNERGENKRIYKNYEKWYENVKNQEYERRKKAQEEYVKMLYASTGNNYAIENDKLIYKGTDIDFKGNRSQTLINVIQSGIDAKETYTLSLVGNKKDDKGVFIDSYSDKKIDVSDLKTLGKASTALQGAAIGHFLNEIQVDGNFNTAHQAS